MCWGGAVPVKWNFLICTSAVCKPCFREWTDHNLGHFMKEQVMSPLRQRMIADMGLRNLSENTKEAYLRAVKQLAKFYRKSPDRLTKEQIRKYLVHLVQEKRVANATYIQRIRVAVLLSQHVAKELDGRQHSVSQRTGKTTRRSQYGGGWPRSWMGSS